MGVGGAFILVPAMIYIIGMPTKLIPGTSLFVTILLVQLLLFFMLLIMVQLIFYL